MIHHDDVFPAPTVRVEAESERQCMANTREICRVDGVLSASLHDGWGGVALSGLQAEHRRLEPTQIDRGHRSTQAH